MQVAVWINSHPICSHLSQTVEEMYVNQDIPENSEEENVHVKQNRWKHKEEGERRREIDRGDCIKIQQVPATFSSLKREPANSLQHREWISGTRLGERAECSSHW